MPRRFAVLTGPVAHMQHLLSAERRTFSVAYLASMALTLYFALGPKSRLPTVLCALVQIGCLLTYLAHYFPGGTCILVSPRHHDAAVRRYLPGARGIESPTYIACNRWFGPAKL